MTEVAVFEAKNRLSELIHRAQAGEEIAITRRGTIVARLVPPLGEGAARRAQDAVTQLRRARRGVTLGRLTGLDLIREGRR